MKKKIPKYISIALDIADRIKKRDIKEGQKLKGRSLAAAEYNVSAETMRKAFSLLADKEIIIIREKSGSIVLSRQKAIEFKNSFKEFFKVTDELQVIQDIIFQNKENYKKLAKSIKFIEASMTSQTTKLPFEHISVQVHSEYDVCGKTLEEVDYFKPTMANLFGIVSNKVPITKLNCDYRIRNEDILYFTGENDSLKKLIDVIKKTK